jgi:hypothetical protein
MIFSFCAPASPPSNDDTTTSSQMALQVRYEIKAALFGTMDAFVDYIQDPDFLKALGVLAASLFLAGQFDNHLWRLLIITANYVVSSFLNDTSSPWWASLVKAYLIMKIPHLRARQKKTGCVFITGADSGMGQATCVHLAKTNGTNGSYHCIFAGAFDTKRAEIDLKEICSKAGADFSLIKVVPLDVTSDKSVADAAQLVKKTISDIDSSGGLMGLVNYHGIVCVS